jgi:hypothetical protein
MEIDTHVNSIVQGIVDQITSQVQTQAMAAIEQKVADVISAIDYTSILSTLLSQKLDAKITQLPISTATVEAEITNRVTDLTQNLIGQIQTQSLKTIQDTVNSYVNKIDFQSLYVSTIITALQTQQIQFPDNSISGSAIETSNLRLSGDNINGGIITNFGSTGIDDKSTVCQVTIMDDITVVENNLLTKDLTVKGTTTIEGNLNVTGSMVESSPMFLQFVNAATNNVRTSLDKTLFDTYATTVFNKIQTDGLDLSKIQLNGKIIIDNNMIANSITVSNLQKVGVLNELQVSGESLFSETLYTTKNRVGINTIQPTQALSLWDQEIEFGIGKQSKDTATLGMPRNQTLVISSNGKNNLTILPDGSIAADTIKIGTVTLTSGSPPSDNQPAGTIVFNSNPTLGGPLGWVSLGQARWGNFGIID